MNQPQISISAYIEGAAKTPRTNRTGPLKRKQSKKECSVNVNERSYQTYYDVGNFSSTLLFSVAILILSRILHHFMKISLIVEFCHL